MSATTSPRLAGFLRRGGINVALCVGIALLLAARPGASLQGALVYSLLIGTLCWLAIDGGRLLIAQTACRARRRRAGGARRLARLGLDVGADRRRRRHRRHARHARRRSDPRRAGAAGRAARDPLPRPGFGHRCDRRDHLLSFARPAGRGADRGRSRAPRGRRGAAHAAAIAARAAHAVQHARQPARADRRRFDARRGDARPR